MNRKGFMMAEVIVVSAIILMAMATYYVSYNKMISLYNQRLNYYDVASLYKLAKYRDKNFPIPLVKDTMLGDNNPYYSLSLAGGTDFDKLYFIKGNKLNKFIDFKRGSENKTFIAYLEYLQRSLNFSDDNSYKYIYVSEDCDNDNKNCKYAYLEVVVKEDED